MAFVAVQDLGGVGFAVAEVGKKRIPNVAGRLGVSSSSLYRCLTAAVATVDPSPPAAGRPAAGRPGVQRTEEPIGSSGLVLVVEDSPVNQLVAVAMLKKEGYRVEVATNGEEATRVFSPGRYDAILMDCQMPVMDGYQATRVIRGLEGDDRPTPVIALTAGTVVCEPQRCLAAGMDDYLSKPINREQLGVILRRWVVGVG